VSKLLPTIFHITHWKAGSQWVSGILEQCAPERFIPWSIVEPTANHGKGMASFIFTPLKPGKVYGTVYLRHDWFETRVYGFYWPEGSKTRKSLQAAWGRMWNLWLFGIKKAPSAMFSNWWNYSIRHVPTRRFFVMRDARDTLISFYFSTKKSHRIEVDTMNTRRQKLNELSEEDGIIYLMDEVMHPVFLIQKSWVAAPDTLVLRYEDILGNELGFFRKLIDYCEIDIDDQRLEVIISKNNFEAVVGRKPGEEDISSHYRKGIAGDWRNHFTEKVKVEFKKKYGNLLIDTGYEKDLNW
jgi:hypothetical protein